MPLHTISPVWDGDCRVLILGSFPSVRSRETGFFYGHPQNRFWRVLAAVYGEAPPGDVPQKTAFLLAHHLALWDVVASCDIDGSADGTIRKTVPNDIAPLLAAAPIRSVFTNGATADRLYRRFLLPVSRISAVPLPSTSPANAAWSLERLAGAWAAVRTASESDIR